MSYKVNSYLRRYLYTSVEPLAFSKVPVSWIVAFSLRPFWEENGLKTFALQRKAFQYPFCKKHIHHFAWWYHLFWNRLINFLVFIMKWDSNIMLSIEKNVITVYHTFDTWRGCSPFLFCYASFWWFMDIFFYTNCLKS